MSNYYNKWPNFTDEELACQHCGKFNDHPSFHKIMDTLQRIRTESGKSMRITSGYRCPEHPIEKAKAEPGMHTVAAVDIGCHGEQALELLEDLILEGYVGIGIQQKGAHGKRFIHVDDRPTYALWSY